MNKQYRHELIGGMQAQWDALSCQQKVDIYFELCGVDLMAEFWRIPECPEYRHAIGYKDGQGFVAIKESIDYDLKKGEDI